MQRRQATLKEKLTEHYHTRDFSPRKETLSTVGMVFFWSMMITLLLEGLIVLLPNYFKKNDNSFSNGYRWAQLLAVILFVETGVNWWLAHCDVLNRATRQTKSQYYPSISATPPGWKNCVTCMLDVPPRSHHCALCNHCILKRDHHCFITGSCIGYYNQKYFLIFCIYASISCAYAAYMQFIYLNEEFPISSTAAFSYFPIVLMWQWMTGVTSFSYLFILMHLYTTVVSWCFSILFIAWQLLIIIRGQTSYEAWKQIMIFRHRSVLDNIHSALGNPLHFLLSFIVPIHMQMLGDGIKWKIEPKAEKGH